MEFEKLKKANRIHNQNILFKAFYLLSALKKISEERKNNFKILCSKKNYNIQRKIYNILVINMSKI